MDWIMLIIAGLTEIAGVIGIKRVALKPTFFNYAIIVGGFIISLALLSAAMETISLSTAYAVWTGLGTVGSTAVGIVVYKESRSVLRLACIAGVIACVIGLRILE